MRKILFVHHGTGVGGAPISMIETIKSLDPKQYTAEVLLLKDSIVSEMLSKEGIKSSVATGFFYKKIYRFFPHIEPEFFKFWQFFRMLRGAVVWLLSRYYFSSRLLREFEYDIIHLNSSVLIDFLAAGKLKGKVVLHIREPVARGYLGIRLGIMRSQINLYADHVIAISRDNAKRLGCSQKTTVVYNFTEIGPEHPATFPDQKFVLYVGGESLIKGFLTIVDSLNYISQDIKVLFCGYYQDHEHSCSLRGRLKRYFFQLTPSNRRLARAREIVRSHPNAVMLGVRNDIAQLLRKSRVLVSPFSVEHFSRPVVEAFANYRCAIGTNVEGMSELIEHEKNGLLVEPNDPRALALAINRICENVDFNLKLAEAGYQKAEKEFSRSNINKIQKIYDSL